ncbi:MAG: polyamine aminopropyltransferase [Myxococcales bacterium]|nr:polyamine aminopropyltransferase [Myxococcales bacterium]
MGAWYEETFDGKVRVAFKFQRTLLSKRSPFQTIEVFETDAFGRALALDGLMMTSERDEFYYHEMLVHPPMAIAPSRERVLVIGGGDGGTVREILRHGDVKSVTMVEIDGEVVAACRELLPSIASCFDHPKLDLRIEDGIRYVAACPPESFDLILLDGSDPVGPAEGLFNRSFYENVRRALKPRGIFALQSESPILQRRVFLEVQNTLQSVFGAVRPYFGVVPIYGASLWSWTVATRESVMPPLDASVFTAFEDQLQLVNAEFAAAAFAVPTYLRRLLPSPAAPQR